jgi:hypothetical protein
METIIGFLLGIGGLVVAGVLLAFLAGWFILASRSKKLKETS